MKSILETKIGGISTKDITFSSHNFIKYSPSKGGNPLLFTYIWSSMWNVTLELSFYEQLKKLFDSYL